MSLSIEKQKEILRKKVILFKLYERWYRQIKINLNPGKTLEIGSGPGLSKNFIDCITSDIVKNDYIDREEDACNLSFYENSLDNIMGIDILHHLSSPDKFFQEADRVLKQNGRIILIEPYISLFSYLVRKIFHHENLDLSGSAKISPDPDQSNLALPTILFFKQNFSQKSCFGNFRIIKLEKQDLIAYPLSGGFKNINIIPKCFIDFLMKLDLFLAKSKFLKNLLSYKMIVVLEKYK
jgi:SAM-dependent methyltransferase